jgi:hypothetical protein
MQYLNPKGVSSLDDNRLPLIKVTDDNKVVKFAKALGYKYIHLSDGSAETNFSQHADIRLTNRKYLSSFSEYLINKTLLKRIKFSVFDPINIKREQILFAFKGLEKVPDIREPTFTFAHIVAPHEPFVFDKNGGIPPQDKLNAPLKYFEQALFINKKMMPLLDKILNRSFFATYLQGVIVMILVAMYFVHAPILLEMLEMSESKFAIGMVFFGISNVITNQLSTRFLIPKIGTTNCLVIARLMYSLLPFFIFYFSNYYFFLFISIIWGVAIGIQAPSLFTQVAIVESRTKKILKRRRKEKMQLIMVFLV